MKTRMKIFQPKTKSVFLPKIRWKPKKKKKKKRSSPKFSPVFGPKLSEDSPKKGLQSKKKGLHSNLVRFLTQNCVKTKKKIFAHRFCAQTLCPSYKGRGHAAICILFYANYTILATRRGGGHGPMSPPLNMPLPAPIVPQNLESIWPRNTQK